MSDDQLVYATRWCGTELRIEHGDDGLDWLRVEGNDGQSEVVRVDLVEMTRALMDACGWDTHAD